MQAAFAAVIPKRTAAYARLSTLLFIVFAANVQAAETANECQVGRWYGVIAQSLPGLAGSQDPASISYTNPDHGEKSYTIDAGFSLERAMLCLDKQAQWDTAFTLEVHKNTEIEKKQDTRAVSLSFLGNIDLGKSDGTGIYKESWFPRGYVSYKENRVKQTHSEVLALKARYRNDGWGATNFLQLGDVGRVVWIPDGGIMYEHTSSGSDTPSTGVSRCYVGIGIDYWPWFRTSWGKDIHAGITTKWWYDVHRSAALNDTAKTHKFRNPYLAFRVWGDEHSSGSIDARFDYVNGEDVETGLENQIYRQFGLKFAFKW